MFKSRLGPWWQFWAFLVFNAALPSLSGCSAVAAGKDTRPDFTGRWEMKAYELVIRPDIDDPPYTTEALRRIEDYKKNFDTVVDDPANYCVPNGMPWTMLGRGRNYSFDIYQAKGRITILHEYMDVFRLIHLNDKPIPNDYLPSNEGYSTAEWEGETLVITTRQIKPRSPAGMLQRSEQMEVVERWTLHHDRNDGDLLWVDMIVTDPVIFTRPVKAQQVLKRTPVGVAFNAYGCSDTLWEKRVEELRQASAAQPNR